MPKLPRSNGDTTFRARHNLHDHATHDTKTFSLETVQGQRQHDQARKFVFPPTSGNVYGELFNHYNKGSKCKYRFDCMFCGESCEATDVYSTAVRKTLSEMQCSAKDVCDSAKC